MEPENRGDSVSKTEGKRFDFRKKDFGFAKTILICFWYQVIEFDCGKKRLTNDVCVPYASPQFWAQLMNITFPPENNFPGVVGGWGSSGLARLATSPSPPPQGSLGSSFDKGLPHLQLHTICSLAPTTNAGSAAVQDFDATRLTKQHPISFKYTITGLHAMRACVRAAGEPIPPKAAEGILRAGGGGGQSPQMSLLCGQLASSDFAPLPKIAQSARRGVAPTQ